MIMRPCICIAAAQQPEAGYEHQPVKFDTTSYLLGFAFLYGLRYMKIVGNRSGCHEYISLSLASHVKLLHITIYHYTSIFWHFTMRYEHLYFKYEQWMVVI